MRFSTDVSAVVVAVAATAILVLPALAEAQEHDHAAMSAAVSTAPAPAGQAAFEAIADVVNRLEADPSTDWSTVDIEALRRHLVDMDRVFMEASVEAVDVPGGARFRVAGSGDAVGSIQRMATAHSRALEGSDEYRAAVETTRDGALVTVTAADGSAETAAKIRGLGFAGLLVLDDHHAPHHWMLATGARPPGH